MSISDSDFIRGQVPLTKFEVRAVTLAKLNLTASDHLLDIGAGTGGISVEAASTFPGLQVTAIDNNAESVELIAQNAQKFGAQNIRIIAGTAPEDLCGVEGVTKVFIGGSKGNLPELLDWVVVHCSEGTTLVANAITLETLEALRRHLASRPFASPDIIQLAINRVQTMGRSSLLLAQNPIFIISTTLNPQSE